MSHIPNAGSIARRFGRAMALFFALGLAAALLMRLELFQPSGWLMQSDTFDKLFSLHGVLMVYFVLLPAFPALIGLNALPGLVHRSDFLFPRLNLLAWRIYLAGGILVLLAFLLGGFDAGWSFAAPYSFSSAQSLIALAATGVACAALSNLLLAVNLIATAHARNSDAAWIEGPLTLVGLYSGALATLAAAPLLILAMVLLLAERLMGVMLFSGEQGGDPSVFNQLFWFAATPALYATILPAAGAMSDLFESSSGRSLILRRAVAISLPTVAIASYFLWGRHLMTSAGPLGAGSAALLSHLIALPLGFIVISWLLSAMRGGWKVQPETGLLRAFALLLTTGLLTGLPLASPSLNQHLHNSVFVVAHLHMILVGGVLTALLADVVHYWPQWTGRTPAIATLRAGAWTLFIGVLLTFLPLFRLGYLGLPRRHHLYPEEFVVLQVLAGAGATILVAALVIHAVALLTARRTEVTA